MMSARPRAHRRPRGELRDYAQERLRRINWLRIFGDAPGKGAIVAFEMKGAHAHDVATVIDRPGRGGARRHPLRPAADGAIRRDVDLPGFLRPLQYLEEVDALAEALIKAAGFVRVMRRSPMADGSHSHRRRNRPNAPTGSRQPAASRRRRSSG